jgi:uncharacterized repeat protein (TIGR02543 family)
MATVSKWTPFGVALDITATAATVTRTSATAYTVKINVSWETYYSGAQTNYGMSASSGGVTSTISAFNGTKRSSGSSSFTGTYSISGNGSATKTVTVTFRNFNTDNGDSATKAVSFNVTVPAWTSYAINYNANGGSGAPSAQTKWKDQTLKLSTTKPTRTGYSFLGWSTSSTATSATYAAGGNYTANAAATLYAVWKANTYTVTYNTNGGTGAPANQTKTYGKNLTLSSTKPTRTNYNFKGWGTSASATTVSYAAGATYSANAGITLYAVWELSYMKPRIVNVSTVRCNSSGTADDEGQNGLVTFDWECDRTISSIVIKWKLTSDTVWTSATVSASGTNGNVSHVIGANALSTEKTYDIHITVSDSGGSSYAISSLSSMKFVIDILNGGNGIAFGKTAEKEGVAEFAFETQFTQPVYGKALGMDRLPAIPENSDFNNYLDPGCWAVHGNAVAATCANIPVTRAGRLEVWSSTGEGVRSEEWSYLRQRYVAYNIENAVWERDVSRGENNVWSYGTWIRTTLSKAASERVYREPKILWSGGYFMTAGHTITLSEAISKQNNGIVLVFSAYTDNTVGNYWWNQFFVPKYVVSNHSGTGHCFSLCAGNFSLVAMKYLLIKDTQITGHDNNNLTGSASGITYANNRFVLRYVIGV